MAARRTCTPRQFRATQALLEGRFDDGAHHGEELRRYARAYRGAVGMHFMQFAHLAQNRVIFAGRELPCAHRGLGVRPLHLGDVRARTTRGRDETAARANAGPLTAEGFRGTRGGKRLGLGARNARRGRRRGGHAAHAATLYDLLTPYGGRLLTLVLGLACLGAADRYLGMLSTVLERWDEADAHFERALAIEQHARGHALLPRTRYWQARSSRARRVRRDDRPAADELLAVVIDDASRLGMQRLRAQAEALRALRGFRQVSFSAARGRSFGSSRLRLRAAFWHVGMHIVTVARRGSPNSATPPAPIRTGAASLSERRRTQDRVPALADVHFEVAAGA